MARGIDHIVHAVRDLDAAAALYRTLGFQVGARNRHPPAWGTQNHIVQFPGTFIELLTIADTSGIVPHASRFFSFGAFNRDFLASGQGLSMLVLEGRGAPDREEFRNAGIGDFALYAFDREGKRPDGTTIKVAFALAFAASAHMPQIGFFTCEHQFPEHFWNPAFQVHDNTAARVAGVVLVAEKPSSHRAFLTKFAGVDDATTLTDGLNLMTPRGDIQLMTPASFERQFGHPSPDIGRGARLAALRLAVANWDTANATLRGTGLPLRENLGKLIVGPESAMGTALVFEPLRVT